MVIHRDVFGWIILTVANACFGVIVFTFFGAKVSHLVYVFLVCHLSALSLLFIFFTRVARFLMLLVVDSRGWLRHCGYAL